MKKALIIIGIIALIVIVAFAIPMKIVVEEKIQINAARSLIYENVSKFENFQKWSPWADLDPNQTSSIKGQDGTLGARYDWSSTSDEVGTGYQTITAIDENKIEMDLVFTAPWESTSKVYFTFTGDENKTTVLWGYKDEGNLVMKLIIGNMLSKNYQDGLNELKTLCE